MNLHREGQKIEFIIACKIEGTLQSSNGITRYS